MMKKLLILIMILIGGQLCFAQQFPTKNNLNSRSQNSLAYGILEEIEESIANAQISAIYHYLSSQIYLSFLNGVSGYYSSNQAYYVLENFLKEYKVTSFSFDNIKLNTLTPLATGTYYYEHKGNRSEAKMYLTLKLTGKSWQITQIAIN
jgi:hypothetical protein